MTDAEAAFEAYCESRRPYVEACESNGRVFWWNSPEELAKLEQSFPGIGQTPGQEALRRFWLAARFEGRRPEPPEGLHIDPRQPEHEVTPA